METCLDERIAQVPNEEDLLSLDKVGNKAGRVHATRVISRASALCRATRDKRVDVALVHFATE